MPRLFFALWPDEPALARLTALARELSAASGGKPTPAGKIHLTVEFLGEVGLDRVARLDPIARPIEVRPFRLAFDHVGFFRRSRVAWVGSATPPLGLMLLHDQLAQRLASAGFKLEGRPFAPHVTLARKLARPVRSALVEPIEWPVAKFALMRSDLGTGGYTTLASWRLR